MIPLIVLLFVGLSTVVNSFAIRLIINKKEQTTQRLTWLLIGTITSLTIWVILTSLQIEPYSQDDNLVGFSITAALSNLLIMVGVILLSSFINYLVRPKLELVRIVIMTAIFSFTFGMYIIMIAGSLYKDVALVDLTLTFANIANLFLVLVYVVWVRRDFLLLLDENLTDNLRKYVTRFYAASIIGFVGNLPIFIFAWFVDQSYLALSYLLITVSMSIMVYNYLQDPRVAFILPDRAYLAIIVNSYGGLQYSKNFRSDLNDGFTVIISGVLNAISGIMSEFYNNPVQPQLIEFEKRQILIKWREGYFLAVFTDRDSPLIRSAMDQTVKEFEYTFGNTLQKHIASPMLLNLDDIFSRTFYFVIMN